MPTIHHAAPVHRVAADGVINAYSGNTSQIGSTTYTSRSRSIKSTITSVCGRAPPGQKNRCLTQDLIGTFELTVLPLQFFELGISNTGHARFNASIQFHFIEPRAQVLRRTANFSSNRLYRCPT